MLPEFMARALQLANNGRYSTSPNPMVGCVIVHDDMIVAEGWHVRAGDEHAEVVALNKLTTKLNHASLYVTLEPCCHQGKTPPCVDAIIEANIQYVFIGCLDSNPQVAGKGVAALKAAGIQVTVGILQDECEHLNRYFFHAIKHKKPYVIAKWAMSLDGKIATRLRDAKWISNAESRAKVHDTRHLVDAILVGSGTVAVDDPQLTVRKVEQIIAEEEQPLRVILDGVTVLDLEAKIFQASLPGETILASHLVGDKNYKLEDLLLALGKRGIRSLLVEGGAQVLTLFFENEAIDEIQCYIAPKLVGGTKALTPFMGDGIEQMLDAQCFLLASCDKQGDDVLLTYYKGSS